MPPDSLREQCKTWQRKEMTYTVSVGSLPLIAQEAVAALAKAEAFPNAPGVLQGAVPLLAGLHALQDRGLAVRRGRPRCRRQQVRSPSRARPTLSPVGASVSGEEGVEDRGRGRGRFGGGVSGADPGARWV